MSVIIRTRGEAGGGVAAHLHCSHCGHWSKSHAQQLSHVAAAHPSCLDEEVVGRLGTIVMFQSSAHLFHCSVCFFTCKDFTKLYKHIISKHCLDDRGGAGGREGGGRGEEGEEEEKGGEEGEKMGDGGEEEKKGDGGEEEKKGDGGEEEALKRKRSSEEEAEDEDGAPREAEPEGEAEDEDGAPREAEPEGEAEDEDGAPREAEPEGEAEDEDGAPREAEPKEEAEDEDGAPREAEPQVNVLTYDGSIYRCLICGCQNKLKVVSVNHVMKKHDIPKAYASQAISRDVVTLRQTLSRTPQEDEEAPGLSGELLNEEMKATAKLLSFTANRFVCVLCGWKTKLKGFAISHVARSHDVERPYGCTDCPASFFLPSRLQQHVRTAHRPGRYACPFCCFRSHYLGGFRRHCSRCNAREEGGAGGAAPPGGGQQEQQEHREGEEGEEEGKRSRAGRKRRMTRKVMEGQEENT